MVFRHWAAISTIAACVEQKVYVPSGGENLHPNLYTALIAHPGVGKTRAIMAAKRYYLESPEPLSAPTYDPPEDSKPDQSGDA